LEENKLKIVGLVFAKKREKNGMALDMLTRTGNLYFMAPEMLEGGGYRESVDVWAAGILLFKLIAGYTPFEDLYYEDVVRAIVNCELTFPPCFDKYNGELLKFLEKIIEKNIKIRYSAQQSLQDPWLIGLSHQNNFITRKKSTDIS